MGSGLNILPPVKVIFLDFDGVMDTAYYDQVLTPSISHLRGDEIDAWLKECGEECRYVIIDDLDGSNFHPHQIPWLLVVNPYNGLDSETAKKAICLLNS